MKAGFYADDLQNIETDDVEDAAKDFAEEHHEIVEESDLKFSVWVEDDKGELFEIKFFTEFDPRFEVETII